MAIELQAREGYNRGLIYRPFCCLERPAMTALLKPMISDAERIEREAAIDYGRASARLEGYIATPEYEALASRFVAGEFTLDQYVEQSLALTSQQLEATRTQAT
jgi:Antitoxin VbhA